MKGRGLMNQGRFRIMAILLALCLAVSLTLTVQAAGEVCRIGPVLYMTLDDALFAAVDGDTIQLLTDIDYSHGLTFVEKDITFDLNGYNLNVENSTGTGLFANNSIVSITGGGEFNVSGTTRGVQALLGASVTVTGAHATSPGGIGVYAVEASQVTVEADAAATGEDGLGAYAESGSSISVGGNAIGQGCGTVCYGVGSLVDVSGDSIATGTDGIGAAAGDGGEIIIDGEIQTNDIYVQINMTEMEIGDVTLPTTKAGYRTYSGGIPESTVWVKMRIVCEIDGGEQYENLPDALADAADGDTLRLLDDILCNSGVSIVGKTVTLDLNGHDLDIYEPSGTGLSVSNGGIALEGEGSFTVTGYECGVHAYPGSVVTVTNAGATSITAGVGVIAAGGGEVTVMGDVQSVCKGVIAIGEGTKVTIGGNVTVEANETWGIEATASIGGGAEVDVGGDVTVNGGGGVLAQGDGTAIYISGSVTATDGGGAIAMYGGRVAVDGNVQASAEGASALGIGSAVTVGHNISATTGVQALSGGQAEVQGGVGAVMLGAQAGYDGSMAIVHGGVIVTDAAGIGAEAFGSESGTAVVQIDGTITADTYVRIGGEVKDGSESSRTTPTLKIGYHTYSSGGDIVYVKVPDTEGETPIVVTDAVTSITASGATLSGDVTNDGGLAVTERGFVYGMAENPTIGASGVIRVPAGSGTGEFSAVLDSLSADTGYHVRAYAINEAGTGYGEDRMFTTLSPVLTPDPDDDDPPMLRPDPNDDDPPTVLTRPVTAITVYSAMLSGRVTSSGGATVTERGFVYGTSANPVIGGRGVTKVTSGGGLGEFMAEITGLLPDTTYYVRTYAVNKEGASYGAIVNFTTELIPPAGKIGWLDAPGADLTSGNVVLYTDMSGEEHIVGLSIVEGSAMRYISRGPGSYEFIYNAKPFDDISGHWAKNDIDFATARLLFIGITPRLFSPDTAMTRGMFAAILGRMYGVDQSLYTGYSFDDVPERAYYAPYVKWARENNILFGVSKSSFEPEKAVTRQEMAAMMHRFMKYLELEPEKGGEEFSDAYEISSWARESVMSLKKTGILNGKPGNRFDPNASSTRAEITAVLRRLIEYIVNK